MCKYCNDMFNELDDPTYDFNEKPLMIKKICSLFELQVFILQKKGIPTLSVELCGTDNIEYDVKIKYCPMCGAKLKED